MDEGLSDRNRERSPPTQARCPRLRAGSAVTIPTLADRIASLESILEAWRGTEAHAWAMSNPKLEDIARHWAVNVRRVLEKLYAQRDNPIAPASDQDKEPT